MKKVNLTQKFTLFSDLWSPKVAGEIGDYYLKLAKLKGEFLWHKHDTEDEMFLVVAGRLVIRLRDGDVELSPGEFLIIPHGVEHMPVADIEAHVVLFEPKTTVNTGDTQSERTKTGLEWI
ncbi:MAG: cupin domain-containing protein [Deltaproteobacteria bacterium]|nr:cupin domain-containing protein [Candidatus Zymogenaceae bacterium]